MANSSNVLTEAVDAVVNSFRKHSTEAQHDVDVAEALQEFWQMKHARGNASPNGSHITYDTLHETDGTFVGFVTLPGGSCFGSFEVCLTEEEAHQSAAKIALVNSVFNEHPTSKITKSSIKRILADASKSFKMSCSSDHEFMKSIGVFKEMLKSHIGLSMLSFQKSMSVFQLLHWNGSLKAMKERHCSREEVIQHYGSRTIDDEMRQQVALDWIARAKESSDVLDRELSYAVAELNNARLAGQELRFIKEKYYILKTCKQQIKRLARDDSDGKYDS